MNVRLALALLLLVHRASLSDDTDRVLEGMATAALDRFPFAVYIMAPVDFCTGSLITKSWVMTSGHCIATETPLLYRVIMGVISNPQAEGEGRQERGVALIKVHPNFTQSNESEALFYDVALIKVKEEFKISQYVKRIGIATDLPRWNMSCMSVTFGPADVEHLFPKNDDNMWVDREREAKHPLLSTRVKQQVCPDTLEEIEDSPLICVRQLKHNGTDLFFGDTGGALVCAGSLAGVASVMSKDGNAYVQAFASTSAVACWIKSYVTDVRWHRQVGQGVETVEVDCSRPGLMRVEPPLNV